jgi:3-hydroxyacyl-CoA dehydrogenase
MEPAPLWISLRMAADGKSGPPKVLIKRRFLPRQLNPTVAAAIADLARRSSTPRKALSHEAIVQRLVYPIINEAARCLDEKIAASADDVDLAMVFGTGFAPFRGGPLRYADSVGLAKIVETLDRLSKDHPRFTPCEALRRKAAAGERFSAEG